MSVNITKHVSQKNKEFLLDPERTKKDLFDQRRKQRLIQVRTKSREIASTVRKNVSLENKKQLKRINLVKEHEQKNSISKSGQETEISEFGKAHQAAEIENSLGFKEKVQPLCGITYDNKLTGVQNKDNIRKIDKENLSYNANTQKTFENKNTKKNKTAILSINNQSLNNNNGIVDGCCRLPICCCHPILTCQCHLNIKCTCSKKQPENECKDKAKYTNCNSEEFSGTTSSDTINNEAKLKSSYKEFKEKQRQQSAIRLTKTPSVIMEVTSEDSDSSSCILEDTHSNANMRFSRIYSRTDNRKFPTQSNYNAKDFQATADPSSELLTNQTVNRSPKKYKYISSISSKLPPNILVNKPRTRFTKISDLLKQNDEKAYIPNDLPTTLDKATQMSDKILSVIPDNNIAKDFCTRGVLVDTNDLSFNQLSNNKNERIISENYNSDANEKDQQTQTKSLTNAKENKSTKTTNKTCSSLQKKKKNLQVGELLGPKSILNIKNTSPKQRLREQIQYYDYNNKFQKQCHLKQNYVAQNEHIFGSLNALENANIERRAEKTMDADLELLRKKSDQRCLEAIEREQVRLDYEALQAKLDILTSDKKGANNIFLQQNDTTFSNIRHKKLATVKENKINNAVEDMLQKPIVITCPELVSGLQCTLNRNTITKGSQKNFANGINLNSNNSENILSFSDSCDSILLNYVDRKSEENCNNHDKKNNLQLLLNRLNSLRSDLLQEMQSSEIKNQKSNSVRNVANNDKIIMSTHQEKEKLEKREKRLQKQEAVLEKKILDFFEMQKSIKNDKNKSEVSNSPSTTTSETTYSPVCLKSKSISAKISDQPFEIIIKVNDNDNKKIKSPYRTPRQKASLINPIMKSKKKINVNKISTPIRLKNNTKKTDNISQTTSTTTAYKSFPNRFENKLNTFLNGHKQQEKNFPMDLPKNYSAVKKNVSKTRTNINLIKKTFTETKPSKSIEKEISHTNVSTNKQDENTINPILRHYIQRLLGMSRQSINMLGISSSTVTTPNSSLVNTSANKFASIDSSFDKERVARLQHFIDDNYSFLSELEESLKTEQTISIVNTSETSQKGGWNKNLIKEDGRKKKQKPILKNFPRELKTSAVIESCNSKQNMLDTYTELAATGAQRIAELNNMIKRVRKEKQKILETTFSSNSENGKNSTEYIDFAEKHTKQQPDEIDEGNKGSCGNKNSPRLLNSDNLQKVDIDSDKPVDIPDSLNSPSIIVPEIEIFENTQLEKNKLTGISRDSGISVSRPLTALGSRESPDTRRDSKSEDLIFEPVLKDIPKPIFLNKSHITTVNSDKYKKTNKPPVALTRFSPQLVEEIPHELSTILEIDTPGTSRLNAFTKQLSREENFKISEKNNAEITITPNENEYNSMNDDTKIDFKKFPTFEEYAKQQNLDLSSFDPELNLYMQNEYKKLLEITQSIKEIEYMDYASPYDYKVARNELKEIITISDLCDYPENLIDTSNCEQSIETIDRQIKNFPTVKEYFNKLEAKDSSSFCNISTLTNEMKTINAGNILTSLCESLPDVNAELKRRNVIQHSFIIPCDNSGEKSGTSDDIKALDNSNSKEYQKSENKNDIYSTEGFEKDLKTMGLNWAQVMLQKTHNSQALSTSTSTESGMLFQKHSKPLGKGTGFITDSQLKSSTRFEISQGSDNSVISESGGQPLNLREFLSQELQKRTNYSTLSSTGSDDSMINLFVRSLLGSITPSTGKQTIDRKQKTSTPVETSKTQSSNIKNNSKNVSSSTSNATKLFSGESLLSSVRFSRSDYDKSGNVKGNTSKDDFQNNE